MGKGTHTERLASQDTAQVAAEVAEGPIGEMASAAAPAVALARIVSDRTDPRSLSPQWGGLPDASLPLDVSVLDRREEEDDTAWYLWCAWLRLGEASGAGMGVRTYQALRASYALLDGDEGEQYFTDLRTYFRWDDRTRVYDSLLQRRLLEVTLEAQDELKLRMVALGGLFMRTAYLEGKKLLDKALDPNGFARLKAGDIVRLAEVGSKLELLARGQATETVEHRADLRNLTDEELESYRNLQAKAESDRAQKKLERN